jgi:hypothetical protein
MEKKNMKKVLVGMMIVVGLVFVAVTWAATEGQATGTEVQTAPHPGMRPGMPMRGAGPNAQGPGGMQQGFENMMKQREEEHKKAVGELEDIKKIAESEKATKTVEALQKMIDGRNEAFKKSIEEIQKRQKERMEMIQKRQQEMNAGTPPVKPENNVKPETKVK